MKIRGIIIAAFVFGILSGVLYWTEHRKPAEATTGPADTPPAILKLDQTAITKLEIRERDAEPILLAKVESGSWQITEPKPLVADQNTVSSMLFTLSSLNSERLVDDKASDLKTYGLDQPAVEVDITQKDNKSHKLLLGDETPTGGAVYAMLAGDPRIFSVSTVSKNSLHKSLNDLRDKRLLTASVDKISRIELIRKNQEIEFGRTQHGWQILKPKPLRADSSKIDDLLRKLTSARMDLSGPNTGEKEAAAAFAHATHLVTAKVTNPTGTQELQIRKNKNSYYGKSNVIEGIYKIGPELGPDLDKGLEDFRNKKLFDFGYDEPDKIDIRSGSKSYVLTRNGEDWVSNGKNMDPASAQALLSKLRELAASRFVDSGFGNPVVEATVTSDAGKRIEKVLIAVSGKDYIAKREHEPSLYALDSGLVHDLLKAADDLKPAEATKK